MAPRSLHAYAPRDAERTNLLNGMMFVLVKARSELQCEQTRASSLESHFLGLKGSGGVVEGVGQRERCGNPSSRRKQSVASTSFFRWCFRSNVAA